MGTRRPLTPRVDDLEEKVGRLERTSARLRRDQSETRRLVRDLSRRVDTIVPDVQKKLDDQTDKINAHVDERSNALTDFVMEQIVDVARQWPASAIAGVTAVVTLAAGVLVNWILAAEHLPHIH